MSVRLLWMVPVPTSLSRKVTEMALCDKRAFMNRREAKAMLHSAQDRNVAHRAECRTYKCDECRCYHLTSMSIEEFEAKKLAKQDLTNPN